MNDSELKNLEQRLQEYNRNRLFGSNPNADIEEYCLLDLNPGQKVEKCRLGVGTFGAVYRICRYEIAMDGRIESYPAAMKAIPLEPGCESKLEKKINDEARIQRLLSRFGYVVCYENIKTMTYADKKRDILIRMELLEGFDSAMERRCSGDNKLVEILRMWRDIATALYNCERVHVIHKDIKPDNIYYSRNSRTYKLGDFGESEICDTSKQPGKSMRPAGTMAYIAPEVYAHYPQARKWAQEQGNEWMLRQSMIPFDIRADMYSLGILVYEKFSGARPFERESTRTRLTAWPEDSFFRSNGKQALKKKCAVRLLERKPIQPIKEIPRDVNDVLLKCLKPDPDQRYATCKELLYAVEGLYQKYKNAPPPKPSGIRRLFSGAD